MLRRLASWCYGAAASSWCRGWSPWCSSACSARPSAAICSRRSSPGTESQGTFDVLKETSRARATPATSCSRVKGRQRRRRRGARRRKPVFAELRKQPHVVATSPYEAAPRTRFIAERQDRLRRDPVRRAGQRRADRPRHAHAQRSSRRRNIADAAGRARRLRCSPTRPSPRARRSASSPRCSSCSIAFGSLLAMGLPIMTALFGIGIGLAIVTLLARVTRHPVVRAAGHRDDRHRRRHRLRAVHQHALPRGAARRRRSRSTRSCTRSTRAGGPCSSPAAPS